MPRYKFQCDACGLQFEKHTKVSARGEVTCLSCKGKVRQLVPGGVSFAFDHSASPSDIPKPQNTGVASLDYDFDKVIAKDSREKWGLIERRVAHKRKIIRDNPGSTGYDLVATDGGDYKIATPSEKEFFSRRKKEIGKKAQNS